MYVEPLLNVENVEASSKFYQAILKCESGHGGPNYEKLVFDGKAVLQLHKRDAPEHPEMWAENQSPGNGIALWFRTDDFAEALTRIREVNPEIVEDAFVSPYSKRNEIWFKDPDGYLIVICSISLAKEQMSS